MNGALTAASDFLGWWTTERTSVLIAAAGVPFLLYQARKAALDSRARSRPMVIASLRHVPYTLSTALDIRNYGPSLARDLTVTFDPPLPTDVERTADGQRSIIKFMTARYAQPIRALAPNAVLSNVYYVGRPGPDGNRLVNAEATPDKVTVHVRYTDDDGHKYRDHFPLDMATIRNETETTGSASPEAQAKKSATALDNISKTLGQTLKTLNTLTQLGIRFRTRRADKAREAQEEKQTAALDRAHAQLLGQPLPPPRKKTRREQLAGLLRRLADKVNKP